MDITELGKRIKHCRNMKHLTQENLAELIDVSPHYIYEIEKGLKCMSLPTLIDISTALNISTDYLLFGHTLSSPQDTNDYLKSVLDDIPPQKRNNIAEVLKLLLPYIK